MAENRICPDCGGEMPPGTLDGHCPRCLARIVFGAPGDPSPDAAPLAEGEEGAEDGQESRKKIPADTAESDLSGQRVGRYKLLEKIGEGGFGIVYMAEQLEPVQRKVALKLIKPGMDSRAIIARFEAERQALALMDHPNIARFYDAGVADAGLSSPEAPTTRPPPSAALYGRPYFVMELVRGKALTDYCDQQQLPTRARLELFIQVCQAVQHAHQKGIIHRDLKPSNVLVTLHDPGTPGVPKIIDFGIAKALDQKLTDKTLFTGFAQLLGTPAYMSPEQAEPGGLDIDTRSDVYSLGVLLYELLTGVTPFDRETLAKAALDEIRRLIRETDPPKPSTRLQTLGGKATEIAKCRQTEPAALSRSMSGDLDWIVMKCLEKDRTRRYETANGLARDVERHLNGEPVSAAAPSTLYRAGKFIRRHKMGLAMAGALLLLLVAGVAASSWEALRAKAAERRALTEAAKSKQVVAFLERMLSSIDPAKAKGRDTTIVREILDQTARQASSELAGQPEVEMELRVVLAQAYFSLGLVPQDVEMARRAVDLARKLPGDNRRARAETLAALSAAYWAGGNLTGAEAASRENLALVEELLGKESKEAAVALNNLGNIVQTEGKYPAAEAVFRRSLLIMTKLKGEDSLDAAIGANGLVASLQGQSRLQEAESVIRRALATYRKVLSNDDVRVAGCLNNLGAILHDEDKQKEAEGAYRDALRIFRKVLPADHPVLATTLNNLANSLYSQGRLEESEEAQRQALAMQIRLLGPTNHDVANSLGNLGDVLWARGNLEQADATQREALALRQQLLGPDHPRVATSLNSLALVLLDKREFNESEQRYREAVDIRRKQLGTNHLELARSLAGLGEVLSAQGRWPEAEQVLRDCLAIREKQAPTNWTTFAAQAALGCALARQSNFAAAEPVLRSAWNGLEEQQHKIPAFAKPRLRRIAESLYEFFGAAARPEEAAFWRSKLGALEEPAQKPTSTAPP